MAYSKRLMENQMSSFKTFVRCNTSRVIKEGGISSLVWLIGKAAAVLIASLIALEACRQWVGDRSKRGDYLSPSSPLVISNVTKAEALQISATTCPIYSINSIRSEQTVTHRKCRPRRETDDICNAARRKYGRLPGNNLCPKVPGRYSVDICRFTDDSIRTSDASHLQLDCDLALCEDSPLYLGTLQPEYGLFTKADHWYTAKTKSEINTMIRKVVLENVKNGFDFCLLSCFGKHRGEVIRQALVFPPYLRSSDTPNTAKHININLVALDSVSRQHFYRQLPKTIEKMKSINQHSKTVVLDYELMQSIGPRTFPNMRALFSGAVDVDSDDEMHTYGLSALFSKYTNLGYQTLLQEDSCWFDSWGAIITDNKHDTRRMEKVEDFRNKWNEMNTKLRHLPIDSLGLTHFSCEAFLQYGVTNQFNWPPKVCYNGHLLSSYFLNYTVSMLAAAERVKKSQPLFLYSHLNTGHEKTGRRITYSDWQISEYVSKMATLKHTLTIVMSDHGPKTTRYSQEYLEGRHEIAHAAMFIIIPEDVRTKLGTQIMGSFITNQHLLISHLDVFRALVSLHSRDPEGLLRTLPLARFCHDIPIYSFMSCVCDESEVLLPDNDENIQWIAEFALGFLNDRISAEFSDNQRDRHSLGYGNCERLVGKRYEKIRQSNSNASSTFTFDIIVECYRQEEVFEVAVKVLDLQSLQKTQKPNPVLQRSNSLNDYKNYLDLPAEHAGHDNESSNSTFHFASAHNQTTVEGHLRMVRWRRVSIFQHYSKCADPGVDVNLCICRKESSDVRNPGRSLARLLASAIFDLKTTIEFVDSKCLALLLRTRPGILRNYEITNTCVDRVYITAFYIRTNSSTDFKVKSAHSLPQVKVVLPWTLHYLTSVSLIGSDVAAQIEHKVMFRMAEIPAR